jgi:hypothetical protein
LLSSFPALNEFFVKRFCILFFHEYL